MFDGVVVIIAARTGGVIHPADEMEIGLQFGAEAGAELRERRACFASG